MSHDELEGLVRTHQAELYRYVRYLGISQSAEAEDLVQETFVAAFRAERQAPADDPAQQAAWLRGIARNQCLMHFRRQRTAKVTFDSRYLESAEQRWRGEFLRGGDGFDFVEALRQCVEKLTGRQREALDMRYAEKASREEMAVVMGMSEDGVKSLLQRLRAALKNCVQKSLSEQRT
jgi:RNA polymerase sigma-70 factor (ECF subfamily)